MERTNWNRPKLTALITLIAIMTCVWLPPQAAYAYAYAYADAKAIYTYSDQAPGVKAAGEGTYLSGDHMVWYEEDAAGNRNIFYKNIATGVSKKVTDYPSIKDNPRVTVTEAGEVVVVWIDKRYVGGGSGMWDVMAKYIDTEVEIKLSSTVAPHTDVTVSGGIVAWGETWQREMFYYDLSQRKEVPLGKGRRPQAANGKIAFISESGDVALYTIAGGNTDIAVDLPYHLFPTDLAYNGTILLWKETDLDWQTKYVMLNTAEPSAKPVDLTAKSYKEKEFPQLFIGNGQAAWVEWKDGVQQLTGADLVHGDTYTIAQGGYVVKTLAFEGGRLVMKGADGSLVYRTITRIEASPSTPGVVRGDMAAGDFGPDGGTLATQDGKARLVFPAGILKRTVKAALESDPAANIPASADRSTGTLYSASAAWKVDVNGAFAEEGHALLTLKVDGLRWTDEDVRKMSVYRWSGADKKWLRAGGATDPGKDEITAAIRESGTYAVFMNKVSFSDMSGGHWSQAQVEVLAAKEIVNGQAGGRFAPDARLTRAEFTKMLLGAMGEAPAAKASGLFKDVPAKHWASGWVETAVKLGLAQGSGGNFQPDASLTREQMVVMLLRALGKEQEALAFSGGLSFRDAGSVSGWAQGHTALAVQMGLIQGSDGKFMPKASSTRAEAAVVVYRYMDAMGTL